jgi:hypothetical protein
MILEHNHFTSSLSALSKIVYMKMLERLSPSIEAILTQELAAGNKIYEVRSDVEDVNDFTVLLEKQYHQHYENDQLTKLITTDVHDHGVYYTTKDKPLQTLLAPYYK